MATILVLFASHYGQTQAIAERIAERLRTRGHEVDLVNARFAKAPPPPQDYDAVVLGSRVELGRHATAIRNYIRGHSDDLRSIPTAFFSVSMAASGANAGADPAGYMDTMFDELGWKPTRAVALGGALPYRKYGWVTRFIMKRISQGAGHTTDTSKNHEFTNWQRVQTWTDEIAALLPVEQDAVHEGNDVGAQAPARRVKHLDA